MSYVIKRVGTLPIVIVKMYGTYDGNRSNEMNGVLERMFESETRKIWRIYDATDYQMSFQVLWDALSYEISHTRWTIKDPRLQTVAVGNMESVYLGVRVISSLLPGVKVPIFASLKEALQYVRARVDATPITESAQ
jgi:hypothetical protein